jgi:hypothetical protein
MLRFLATIAVILWIVLGMAALVSFAPKIEDRPRYNTEQHNAVKCYEEGSPSLIRTIFCWSGDFIDAYHEDISAVSTVIIAIFTAILGYATWFLYGATRGLVREAKNTADRQLRAYIFLENAFFERTGVENFAIDTWAIQYRLKNFGRTPAHKVEVTYSAEVVQWDGELTMIPIPNTEVKLGSMAPNGDFFEDDANVVGRCTPSQLVAGINAIYLVGIIKYIDVFGIARWTNFNITLAAMWAVAVKKCPLIIRAMMPTKNLPHWLSLLTIEHNPP